MMFVAKRQLIATLLIVGFLVASLGLYEAFHPQQAEANCSTFGRIHDYYDWNTGKTKTPTGNRETWKTNCPRCPNYPASDHTAIEYDHANNGVFIWKHRWFGSSNWDHCHSHRYSTSYPLWDLVHCNRSGGGDN